MPSFSAALALEAKFLSAAITSNLKLVKACINDGVNVNAYIRVGTNALHIAAERGDIPLVITLALSPDLNYNAKTDFGYTALMLGCMIKKRSFVRFLMKHHADPNAQDRFGRTALHIICRVDAVNLAFELFKYPNVQINICDCYGATPLLIALLETHSLHMAKLLLNHGATLEVGPERSMPFLLECISLCEVEEDIKKVLLLVSSGADVNAVQELTGKTALHFVALTGLLPLATQLVVLGAELNKKDVGGRVASDVAWMHGHYELYKYLKDQEITALNLEKKMKVRVEVRDEGKSGGREDGGTIVDA